MKNFSNDVTPEIIQSAVSALQQGRLIAYPTEGVYGLGCDPFNAEAVNKLLTLKKRSIEKGLILVAASWEQFEPLVESIPLASLQHVLSTWPGPVTWVFPAGPSVPKWVRGNHESVAIRVSAHPVIVALSRAFNKPLVSTSANFSGQPPSFDDKAVAREFAHHDIFIIRAQVGGLKRTTVIREAVSGRIIRSE